MGSEATNSCPDSDRGLRSDWAGAPSVHSTQRTVSLSPRTSLTHQSSPKIWDLKRKFYRTAGMWTSSTRLSTRQKVTKWRGHSGTPYSTAHTSTLRMHHKSRSQETRRTTSNTSQKQRKEGTTGSKKVSFQTKRPRLARQPRLAQKSMSTEK